MAPGVVSRQMIFQLGHAQAVTNPVVVCLHHVGGWRHLRVGVSLSVGHCAHASNILGRAGDVTEEEVASAMKDRLRRGKCHSDMQALKLFLGRLQLDNAGVVAYKGTELQVPAAELRKELVLDVHRASHWSCQQTRQEVHVSVQGLVQLCIVVIVCRSHSDGAVLCAGVSFSWARPARQPNESWVSRRIS